MSHTRGFVVALGLVALEAVVTSSSGPGRVGGLLGDASGLLKRFMDPAVPAFGPAPVDTTAVTGTSGVVTPAAQLGASSTADELVGLAAAQLGKPYEWGAAGPNAFDCSGLVQFVFGQAGETLPRTSFDQVNTGTAVPDLAQAEPGDLVFFDNNAHVGIYAGGGEMIDAAHSGAPVREEQVWPTLDAIRREPLPAPSSSPLGPVITV